MVRDGSAWAKFVNRTDRRRDMDGSFFFASYMRSQSAGKWEPVIFIYSKTPLYFREDTANTAQRAIKQAPSPGNF